MILDKKNDDVGVFYKLGLIQREALTLENYASSEFGNRFYSEQFLEGFCHRRNEIHAIAAKRAAAMIILTTVLAFFDSLEGSNTIFGLTFVIPAVGAAAVCVLVAMSLMAASMALADQLIIDRFHSVLGERIGVFSFHLATINYTAQNLWASALSPKYFGLKSDSGHNFSNALMNFMFLIFGFLYFSYPVLVIFITSYSITSADPTVVEIAMLGVAGFIVVFAVIFFVVFAFSYKFRPSGTAEPDKPFVPEDFLDLGHPRQEEDTITNSKP